MIAEAIASGYSLIVLFVSSKSLLWRLILILDVVMKPFHSFFQFFFFLKYVCYIHKKYILYSNVNI